MLDIAGRKLLDQKEKFMCLDIKTHDTAGRLQETIRIPVKRLPLWLAAVNANNVAAPAQANSTTGL